MTNKKLSRKLALLLASLMLSAALALTACSNSGDEGTATTPNSESSTEASDSLEVTSAENTKESSNDNSGDTISDSGVTEIGEGDTSFAFEVTMQDGTKAAFNVHTNETTVGAALLGVDLIAGDDSEYGLYVTTVIGVTLDYNTDNAYWAFYIDGEYATVGVDGAEIESDRTYAFVAESA